MKSSYKKTIMKKNKQKISQPKGPLEWIYVMKEARTMRDIYELLRQKEGFQAEYWEDAQVMELTFEEAGGMDFEQSEESDILWVTVSQKGYDQSMKMMKEIEKICGGEFSLD